MILIISINNDKSTFDVAKWLLYNKTQYFVLKETDDISELLIKIDNNQIFFSFNINNTIEVSSDNIDFLWIRRDGFNIKTPSLSTNNQINNNIKDEWLSTKSFILNNNKKTLGYYSDIEINKLQVLKVATAVGLKIPKTIICTNNKNLQHINAKRIICKHISNLISIQMQNKIYSFQTTEIDRDTIAQTFFPSLFQDLIEKKYELRIFFLKKKFYPMAIFSQLDKKTEIDFRNYNYATPNRAVPFKLPFKIKQKLMKLIKILNLHTGSIDMIVTQNDDYYFLEVNPHGQFGSVSATCNYYIEKEIADFLNVNNNEN